MVNDGDVNDYHHDNGDDSYNGDDNDDGDNDYKRSPGRPCRAGTTSN